ncbi:MFS transporter [Streptomyces mirabilis]|uniref:MFS transporter n=1 Tax=Streptomyces mirabilis TaxID=68239 RepID=UPI00371112C0
MTQTPARSSVSPPALAGDALRGLLGRQLDRYPSTGARATYLIIVVLATITLYYQLYVQGSVATILAAHLHMTLVFLISVSIVGNAVGACAAIVAGLADRWGRANLVVYGLAVTGALELFGLANATNKWVYLITFALVSFFEGMVLVATPALIRDFSPQLSRATAMCFWTMGPVLGSLVVSEVASHTLETHTDWQFQYRVSGTVGLAVFLIAFAGLRELAPRLRDQLMVSARDKALIEANARVIEPNAAPTGHWKQMLRKDIIGPAFAIGIFLLFYYCAVGLFVVYFATNFGYSEARANALSNWYWSVNAGTLLVAGALSDALKVRKPFMLLGGAASAVGVALFALAATRPHTGYYEFVGILMPIAIGSAFAFSAWMAAFTETVEKHNPAATATGLAVWASTLRTVVVVGLLALIAMTPAASTLVGKGPRVAQAAAGQTAGLSASENATVTAVAADPTIPARVRAIATKDAAQLATAQKLTPQTQAALKTAPHDPAPRAQALSEISGIPVHNVAQVITLGTRYATQLATAQAIDAPTQAALKAHPADAKAQAKAAGEIAKAFAITPARATARLQALAAVPQSARARLAADATPVQTAASQLTALSQVPANDLALVARYGPGLKDPKVVAELKFLQANAPTVRQASKQSPAQWQRWWWICFAGQLLFLPFIWLLTGRWSPKKAKQDAREHAERVERQLAALAAPTN